MATDRHGKAGETAERDHTPVGGSDQSAGAGDADRARAFENIRRAAEFFGVDMQALGRRPRARRTVEDRQESARKAAAARKRKERRPPET